MRQEPNAHHQTRGRGRCRVTRSPLAKDDAWWRDKRCALFTLTQPVWELCHPAAPSSSSLTRHPHALGDSSILWPHTKLAGTLELAQGHCTPGGLRSGLTLEGSSPLGEAPSFGGTTHPRGQLPSTSRVVPGWEEEAGGVTVPGGGMFSQGVTMSPALPPRDVQIPPVLG